MNKTHRVDVAGLTRDLPIITVPSGVRLAVFNILGDIEMTKAAEWPKSLRGCPEPASSGAADMRHDPRQYAGAGEREKCSLAKRAARVVVDEVGPPGADDLFDLACDAALVSPPSSEAERPSVRIRPSEIA